MKNFLKSFLQTVKLGLFLGLLSSPAQNWCAAVASSGDLGLQSPSQPLDHSLIEKSSSGSIDATYAVKHLLSSIMEKFPHLTVQEALSRSALLGIISETEVQLHMYGAFITKPDPKIPGRNIKVFAAGTPLNKIARAMFDVLDEKLRPTALASNPFVGINGKVLAKIMTILSKDGAQGFINALEKPTPSKKKTRDKKEEAYPEQPEELSLLDEWWESYKSSGIKGVFSQKSKFVAKILGDQTKKSFEDDIPFIELLKQYVSESLTAGGIDSIQVAKQKEELSKMLMTFLYLKDQKQKATGESHALEEYYREILGTSFKIAYYRSSELEALGKLLLDSPLPKEILSKNAANLENVVAYFTYFIASDIVFLQTPLSRFKDCAEATTRSFVNSVLYNQETGLFDITMLPSDVQATMKQEFKNFFEKYPDPTVLNYYGQTFKEWVLLVSGLDGVEYKHGKGKDASEISAAAGPKNLISTLNAIFGIKINSAEALASALEVKNSTNTVVRKVSLTSTKRGFDLQISNQKKVTIQAEIFSIVGTEHASFLIKGNTLRTLLKNKNFRLLVDNFKQNLYGIVFKSSTLNLAEDENVPTPLLQAIKSNWEIDVKSMLAYGADPNFNGFYFNTPLEQALSEEASSDIINALLQHGAIVTEKALAFACSDGDITLVENLISLREQNGVPVDIVTSLLQGAILSKSFPLVKFLLSKGKPFKDRDDSEKLFLFHLAIREDLPLIVDFLIEQDPSIVHELSQDNESLLGFTLSEIQRGKKISAILDSLIKNHATLTQKEQENRFLLEFLSKERNFDLAKFLIIAKIISPEIISGKGRPFLSYALSVKSYDLTRLLIQQSTNFKSNPLIDIIESSFNSTEKIQLVQDLLEKGIVLTPAILKSVNELVYHLDNEKEQNDFLKVIEQAQTEQSFGLNLTPQEQKCITKCVTESA